MKKESLAIFVVVLVLMFLAFFYYLAARDVAQLAPEIQIETIESKVTILPQHIAIQLNGFNSALIGGSVVSFGVAQAPDSDLELGAEQNAGGTGGQSTYEIVSTSTTDTVVCISATPVATPLGLLPPEIFSFRYDSTIVTDGVAGTASAQTPITSAPQSSALIPPGSLARYRFWMSLPAGSPSGAYVNTIRFVAVSASQGC